jgi:hypothetical protein
MRHTAIVYLLALTALQAQEFNRGVGLYPGDPKEDFGPTFRIDSTTYRNLALRRPAWHSSAYDYNLTAQLVTDGIRDTSMPRWVAVSSSQAGVLKRNEREWLIDDNWVSTVDVRGRTAWVQLQFGGGDSAPLVDRISIDGSVRAAQPDNQEWTCTVLGSDDGKSWNELGQVSDMARPSGEIKASIPLKMSSTSRYYRLQFDSGRPLQWQIGEVSFFNAGRKVHPGGPYSFTSAWMSAGAGQQWVYVDLGAECSFDRINLYWIRRAQEGEVQVSSDASKWDKLQTLPASSSLQDEIKLAQPARGRYVRLLMNTPPSAESYILSEMEVYGRGGPVPQPKPAPAARPNGRQDLSAGGWRLQRGSLVPASGEALSAVGFKDDDWIPATVPGTVLASYLNAGALPDPNFGDNQLMISDTFFYDDFWYRDEFVAPAAAPGKHLWLNFDGINWKADVFLNGAKIGRIEGGFMRGRFDVTSLLRPGAKNALAVRVLKNDTPGSIKEKTFENPDKNGGALGADNPTFHASIGWDWIPTVRGRNTGIWNRVYIDSTGPVTLSNPFVSSTLPLPDTTKADVKIEVTLRNLEARPVSGTLRGRFGAVPFEQRVSLEPSATQTVKLSPSTHPALRLENPKLWWPAGYGDPNLYDVQLSFETAPNAVSDSKALQAGVRQFTYSEEGGALRFWINGRRFIPRGGNWGFSESMLRYRAREYDAAIRYHSDMHFNMIRNWVGQVGEDELYEACDRHGIVVMQDFWLANPWDGPDPDNNAMFMSNARDTMLRVRSHPSIGLYCGRNEGYPQKPLDDSIKASLAELHPGIQYIPSSADDVVTGHGPYRAMPLRYYFQQGASTKFHSEMGMPNIVSMDSLKDMMPAASMWPQGAMWGLHDFCLNGAQGGSSFRELIERSYGGAKDLAEWLSLAQFVNYEGYRAMFEAQGKNRMGLLIWMSHPAWPSMVWQTYDFYFDPTAGYFGSKKGSEPLHIQWNPVTDNIEVVNYSAGQALGLTAQVQLLNMDGTVKWEQSQAVDSAEDSLSSIVHMEYPQGLTPVHFIRLRLTKAGQVLSENLYWRGNEEGNYRAIRDLPKVKLDASTRAERKGKLWLLTTELANTSNAPALMVNLKAVRAKSGDRILPAIYSDNYIVLMPGERKVIRTELQQADTRGEDPAIVVQGFNTK